MDYSFVDDLRCIRLLLDLTQVELAEKINVEPVTLSRQELHKTLPSAAVMERVYAYAYDNGIDINRLKEMFWREELASGHKLLFHGAKSEITGPISVSVSKASNDFGQGFYAGETYEQAVTFVADYAQSSVYYLDFDSTGLRCKTYSVDQDWMMTIAYHRGVLADYESHPRVQKLISEMKKADYVIAPIADNRMFQIINSFISGEITDEQCKHCLSAINLGMQYVFLTEEAAGRVTGVERCYIAKNERRHYAGVRSTESKLGYDKVKLARIKYRGTGQYIDEILDLERGT